MELVVKAANSGIWNSIESVGVQAISFFVFAVIAHYVTPHDFGLIALSFLVILSLQSILIYNVTVYAMSKATVDDLVYTTTFWISLIIGGFFSLLIFIAAPIFAHVFGSKDLASVLRSMSVILFFMGLARTHETWLLRNFLSKSMAIRGLAGAVFGGAVGIYSASCGYGVYSLVIQQVVTSFVSLTLLWFVTPWRPSFQFDIHIARGVMSMLYKMAPNSMLYTLTTNCDVILISTLFGTPAAGLYSVAKRIRLAVHLAIAEPLKPVSFSVLAELQHDKFKFGDGVAKILRILASIFFPVFFLVGFLSEPLITLSFGPKWVLAAPVLSWLSVSGAVIAITFFCDNVFLMKERPAITFYISLSSILLVAVLSISLRDYSGVSFSAYFSLPYVLGMIFSLYMLSVVCGVQIKNLISAIVVPLVGVLSMYFVSVLANSIVIGASPIIHVASVSVLLLCTYFLTMCVIAKKDVRDLFSLINTLIHKRNLK